MKMNDRSWRFLGTDDNAARVQTSMSSPFPEHLANSLERRYESVFSSLARLSGDVLANPTLVYLDYEDDTLATIILYQLKRRRITILNEYLSLSSDELERMVRFMFRRHPGADVISIASLRLDAEFLAFPVQRFNATEDIVIALPRRTDDYFSALGANTRAAIRKSQKIVAANMPPIEFVFYEKADIGGQQIEQLIELSRLRIAAKNEVPAHSDRSIAQLRNMIEAYGLTLLAKVSDEIVGGVICTHIGRHVYMHVVTHDRRFDAARLGLLCCYLSICESIRRGAQEYHLLSGRYDYKYRLLGVQRDYDRTTIYRSRTSVLSNTDVFINALVRGHGRRIKQHWNSWRKKWTR